MWVSASGTKLLRIRPGEKIGQPSVVEVGLAVFASTNVKSPSLSMYYIGFR